MRSNVALVEVVAVGLYVLNSLHETRREVLKKSQENAAKAVKNSMPVCKPIEFADPNKLVSANFKHFEYYSPPPPRIVIPAPTRYIPPRVR